MDVSVELAERRGAASLGDFDAIIIGAGISGIFMLYRLRELGMTARVFETGTDVGGTWYWNRYPGARFDSESWTYGYSFSKELMKEWDWKEHFSPQPDTLEYLNHVADKFDLRRDMQFRSTVTAAHWDDAANIWGKAERQKPRPRPEVDQGVLLSEREPLRRGAKEFGRIRRPQFLIQRNRGGEASHREACGPFVDRKQATQAAYTCWPPLMWISAPFTYELVSVHST